MKQIDISGIIYLVETFPTQRFDVAVVAGGESITGVVVPISVIYREFVESLTDNFRAPSNAQMWDPNLPNAARRRRLELDFVINGVRIGLTGARYSTLFLSPATIDDYLDVPWTAIDCEDITTWSLLSSFEIRNQRLWKP